MKFTMRKALGVAAAVTALTVALPSPAMASDSYHEMNTGDAVGGGFFDYSGEATFTEHGDIVKICDTDEDGHAVKMWVKLDGPKGPTLYTFTRGGEGNCATRRASDGGVYNLPENRYIGFLFCRIRDGHESECGGYRFYNDH
ncbi:hypothetical protein [Micromonospora coxensis]|uniref:Uncharacterized protein n=1 Tax=Micromonospora coxensis TaxID=356852 RepID=A0A1C5IVW2_9ACTN|nr:hypothetical protein [Micromonospora coxensis]SCG62303.1 hypothetical protein GA0070614_3479 [Micromonospora coxensis]